MRNDIPFELLLVAYVSLMKPEMMKQMRDRPVSACTAAHTPFRHEAKGRHCIGTR